MKDGQAVDTAAVEEADGPGIIAEIGTLPPGAIVTEDGLARMSKRCAMSIRRAVVRGELPPGCRMFNATCWTVGSIISHVEGRLAEARKAREAMLKKISQISS